MADILIPKGHTRDPFQGFDIKVTVRNEGTDTNILKGAFTGFMCRIQVQTEAYLALNQRVPRMLDGLIITTWMLEQGLQTNTPIKDTFGEGFARGFGAGRVSPSGNAIPRTRRFAIDMETMSVGLPAALEESTFWATTDLEGDSAANAEDILLLMTLRYARIDNGNFGVVAGGRVATSSWQGTAQSVGVGKKTT